MTFRPAELLLELARRDVRFLVVGGVAARLHGAPVTTNDVDVLYALDDENIERVLEALQALGAVFRQRPDLRPGRSHVASTGHKLLSTRFGRFDLLGHVAPGLHYADLEPRCVEYQIEEARVLVLDLEALIEIKRACGRPRDLAMLPILEAALDERG